MAHRTPTSKGPERPTNRIWTAIAGRNARAVVALFAVFGFTCLTTAEAAAAPAQLTAEERALLADGLLPRAYSALRHAQAIHGLEAACALGRRGTSGPFSDDFGNPAAMLEAARYARVHPAYARFLKGLRRGDLVFVADEDPRYLVALLSGGPFCHVLLCTDPEPPGRFIEATGISGVPGDRTGHQVRRASAWRYANPRSSLRVTHPAEGQPEVIERAIAFAEAQLGKPYNYTFSDSLAGDRGYYCSSFVYEAFRQAGLAWVPDKSAERDRLPQAILKPLLALEPRDPLALSVACMAFVTQRPAPTDAELAHFVVRQVLPACRNTARLAPTEAQQVRLTAALERLLANEAPSASDVFAVATALDVSAGLKALYILAREAFPFVDHLTALATGSRSSLTRGAVFTLDMLDAVRAMALRGPMVAGATDWPCRAPWVPSDDLVSPTDLAWSLDRHEDYNIKPSVPLDRPWPYVVVPKKILKSAN